MKKPRVILIITPDGKEERRELEKKLTLEEMQAIVGGYIEYVPKYGSRLRGHEEMIVNEEGLLDGLPYNRRASDLAGRTIVGTVFIDNFKGWGA